MKKILIITSHSYTSGIETHTYDLICLLIQEGYEVEALAPVPGPWVKKVKDLGIPVHVYNFYKNYFRRLVYLYFLFKKRKFDIIHCHAFTRVLLIPAFFAGVKKRVWSVHVGGLGKKILQGASRLKLTDLFMDKFVHINIANSYQTKNELIKRGIKKTKIKVMYYWLSNKWYNNENFISKEINTMRLGCIGRLENQKGMIFLLQAIKLLNNYPIQCAIAGSGSLYAQLKNFTVSNHIQDKIQFLGDIQALQFYSQIDLLIVPSVFESFGLVILEGASQGLPILASDLIIFRELNKKIPNIHFFKALDYKELAEKLQWMIQNKEQWKEWGAANKKSSSFFSQKTAIDILKSVYV